MKEKVLAVIADYKGVEPETLDSAAEWADLGFDSLDVTELVMRLEDELGVEIELSSNIANIDALVEYIEKL